MVPVDLRVAQPSDVARLVELNHAAYPDLVEAGVVFEAAQLRAHLERFPHGQIVAEAEGEIVGAVATLILPRVIDALAQHTWTGVTDNGTFARHDPAGDTLYLADIYVDKRAWGLGIGRRLYGAPAGGVPIDTKELSFEVRLTLAPSFSIPSKRDVPQEVIRVQHAVVPVFVPSELAGAAESHWSHCPLVLPQVGHVSSVSTIA